MKKATFLAYFALITTFIAYHLYFANKILPNVQVNGINIGGLTPDEAIDLLGDDLPQDQVVKILVKGNEVEMKSSELNFRFLPVASVKKAFDLGRSNNFLRDIKFKILSMFDETKVSALYDYDQRLLETSMRLFELGNLDEYEDARFEYSNGKLAIIPGKSGEDINDHEFKSQIIEAFSSGKNERRFSVNVAVVNPSIVAQDLEKLKPVLEEKLKNEFSLTYEDSEWKLSKEDIISLIKPIQKYDGLELGIDKNVLLTKLDSIAEQINRNPRGQILEVENERVKKFVASQNGQRLKVKETYEEVEKAILAQNSEAVKTTLVVEQTEPPDSENEYQITDVLGEGTSQFRGSDAGRVHNIETAVNKVNGILVAPGHEFSFVEAIGPINRAAGFGSAKVISGGRTVLGDGGGVCQVSTTVFRAALNSGLQITSRSAHSYRVGYYEQGSPPGLDATIYSPSVDFRFKNDTSNYILVAAEIDKANYKLKYTIYGKNDGRTVEVSEPKILSRTPPPGETYIDDPSLDKGARKQVESAIWGANVVFNRTVKKGEEILYNDTFKSNYRAWGAVYMVGTRE